MKIKITAARTFAGKQFENFRPEITLILDEEDSADIDGHMQILEQHLDKAEARWRLKMEEA